VRARATDYRLQATAGVPGLVLFAFLVLAPAALTGEDAPLPAWPAPKLLHEFDAAGDVRVVRISPDGQTLCAGTGLPDSRPFARTRLHVVDLKTFKKRFGPLKFGHTIQAISFSPDSRLLAVDAAKCTVVGCETGQIVCELNVHGWSPGQHPSFISNDEIVCAEEQALVVVAAKDGKRIRQALLDHRYRLLAVSSDMRHIAAVTEPRERAEVHLISVKTFDLEKRIAARVGCTLKWSADSQLLFLGGEPNVVSRFYSMTDGRDWDIDVTYPMDACFMQNAGALAAAYPWEKDNPGGEMDCWVFSTKTGKRLGKWNLHAGRVSCVASSGDVLVSGGWDSRVKIWRLPKIPVAPQNSGAEEKQPGHDERRE
jgi:WD40 repeat protein